MMMVAPLAKEYEMLPIIENVGILRNIIYSGMGSVLCNYEQKMWMRRR